MVRRLACAPARSTSVVGSRWQPRGAPREHCDPPAGPGRGWLAQWILVAGSLAMQEKHGHISLCCIKLEAPRWRWAIVLVMESSVVSLMDRRQVFPICSLGGSVRSDSRPQECAGRLVARLPAPFCRSIAVRDLAVSPPLPRCVDAHAGTLTLVHHEGIDALGRRCMRPLN